MKFDIYRLCGWQYRPPFYSAEAAPVRRALVANGHQPGDLDPRPNVCIAFCDAMGIRRPDHGDDWSNQMRPSVAWVQQQIAAFDEWCEKYRPDLYDTVAPATLPPTPPAQPAVGNPPTSQPARRGGGRQEVAVPAKG